MLGCIILWILLHRGYALQTCNASFCPPFAVKPKYHDIYRAPVFLGEDAKTGCICREMPNEYVICFGRTRSCNYFSKNFNITTPELFLKSTAIKILKKGDFENLHILEKLKIEGNLQLTRIEPGLFKNMEQLSSLSIILNPKLKYFEAETFDGLKNLQELVLVKNGFIDVSTVAIACSPTILPNLKKLDLTENSFLNIDKNDFLPMDGSILEELNLILCGIEYIHPESLTPLSHLEALRIGENQFNVSVITDLINKTVEIGIPLKLINMYLMGFRKAPPKELMNIIAASNVSTLYLARNQFETITSTSFPDMPNIELLDLSEVLVHNISPDAFEGMPKLKSLLLNKNKLSHIPNDIILPSLTYLELQECTDHYLSWNFSLQKHQFRNMTSLEHLDLQFTRVMLLAKSVFEEAYHLRVLGLKNCSIVHIDIEVFRPLINLEYLDLENNFFASSIDLNRSLDVTLFKGLNKLEVLLLGGNGLAFITQSNGDNPFQDLTSLRHLGLERNKILALTHHDISSLQRLESLDISKNLISSWQNRILDLNRNLKALYASHNKLSYMSSSMLDDFFNLTKLELDENPFSCVCASFESFHGELRVNISIILQILITGPPIFCVYPEFTTNLTVYEYLTDVNNIDSVCFKRISFNFVYVIPILLLVGIFCVLTVLVYLYRWHFRYWIFLTRLYLSRTGKTKSRKTQTDYNYSYDAFVSYSNQDQSFVIRMVNMLENQEPFLKLCVYERDFLIGSMICESVLENIARSRKTLLIISNSYAKSYWCTWETHIAEHHRLFFEDANGKYVDDSLVLIKLGPVNESYLTPTLKYLLKTRIYLQWDPDDDKQKVFWKRLRNALAPPKVEENSIITHI